MGWIAAIVHCPPHLNPAQLSRRVITGRVMDLKYTDFSMRLTIDVLDPELPRCRVLLSTRDCDYTLQTGDLVSWPGKLTEVGSLGNPDEMDYARYLLNSDGIRYQQHMPLRDLKRVGHSPTLLTRLANVRRDLKLKVLNTGLTPQSQAFVVTLLLGDNTVIDKATRQQFQAAGVAHVLALSGLHIAIISLIIWWLLFPLDYLRLKKLRLFITLSAIALFAVFTGLSPSVVRATLMTGIVFASVLSNRRSQSLNALALAALVILVFSPSALYSVGFQLSFITVGAVVLFARVPRVLESRYGWMNRITATLITSLVAMVATMALTAHYFHVVSLMSVFSNLLVLPVLPLFMVLAAMFLMVTAAGMQWPVLNWIIDAINRYIHWSIGLLNALPLSHVSGIYVSTIGVVTYFLMMALIVLWLYRRSYRYLLCAGVTACLMLAHSLWMELSTPRQGLVMFNSPTSTPVFYYDHGTGYVWTPDDEEVDSTDFARYYSGFIARHSIEKIHFIGNDDTLSLKQAMIKPPYAHLMGRRIVAVGAGKWKHQTRKNAATLDDVIVTKRYHSTVGKLKELYQFDQLIISGAMYEADRIILECDSLHVPAYSLKASGAYCITH